MTSRAIDNDTSIGLEDISVRYRVPRERISGIKEYTIRFLQRRLHYEQFWALREISFRVQRGEVFGVIGRNGSGKSTLLKVIARVLEPPQGRVVIRGRVAPLLELGAGFQVELTGRENIYLNSALLGRTHQETHQLLEEIIAFAEIGDFIDAPIRTYSTGMVARLGFAVAACVRPDVLLVDEVLSVGDSKFQQKCLDRMRLFREQGTTIVIVSHSMATIESFCDRALWLDSGHARALGRVDQVIDQYIQMEQTGISIQQGLETALPTTELDQEQISRNIQQYLPLHEIGETYPTIDNLNIKQGAVSAWLKFRSLISYQEAVIFHTDDSRYVLYVGLQHSKNHEKYIPVLVARAAGNRRVLNTFYGTSSFPEVSTFENQERTWSEYPFPVDEWHLVTMTWEGHPAGNMRLFIDGRLVGEHEYDSRYDDGRSLPRNISAGMRPAAWAGELVIDEGGTISDSRPPSVMSAAEAGVEIRDLRLYQKALSTQEILAIKEGDSQKNLSQTP
jgi:ABC-type polysaccharide/polyol phosphate transport system ATPase subunit